MLQMVLPRQTSNRKKPLYFEIQVLNQCEVTVRAFEEKSAKLFIWIGLSSACLLKSKPNWGVIGIMTLLKK